MIGSRLFLVFSALSFSLAAWAYIPPLPSLLKSTLEGRKAAQFELVLHHRVTGAGNVVIDEKILADRGRAYFIWQIAGLTHSVGASFDGKNYVMGGGRNLVSRSAVFDRYLTASGSDPLAEALLNEGFIRADQLKQFKPDYKPEGNPDTWETKDNYLRHPDIYLERLKPENGILPYGIAITGTSDANMKKTVVFDEKLRGLRRLEWKEGQDEGTWAFDSLASTPGLGYLPHHLALRVGQSDVVTTDLVRAFVVKGRQVSEFKNELGAAERDSSLTPEADAALKLLLSYR